MNSLHLTYAIVGVLSMLLALFSNRIRDLPVSEPLLALLLGVALGPLVLDLVPLSAPAGESLMLEGTRLLLAASVMTAALRFPFSSIRPLLPQFVLLLCVVMPLAAAVTSASALLLGLPLALAFVVGVCLCPTDPVLASSVVTGGPAERSLPGRLRRLLTGESGANDGLALPLVGVAVAVALPFTGPADAVGRLVWEVLGGAALGVLLGAAAGRAMEAATRERELEQGPSLLFTLLLAVTVLGAARLIGVGGVLAVFCAGLAYNRTVREGERYPQQDIDEAVNRYLALPVFVLLGIMLPWREWIGFGPAAAAFVVAVLLLRRLPWIVLAHRPLGLRPRGSAFLGWFGPMGVSALFYAVHSAHEGVHDPRLFAAVTLAVTASVVAHGLTSSPLRRLYARTDPGRD